MYKRDNGDVAKKKLKNFKNYPKHFLFASQLTTRVSDGKIFYRNRTLPLGHTHRDKFYSHAVRWNEKKLGCKEVVRRKGETREYFLKPFEAFVLKYMFLPILFIQTELYPQGSEQISQKW